MNHVAFVDTETTGLDPERHQVWEIAVIVDDEEHVWQQNIGTNHGRYDRPDAPWQWGDRAFPTEAAMWDALTEHGIVDQWVVENTGIRERYDHDAALSVPDSYERFWTLVHGRHIVGACPWFDSERLHRVGLFLDRLGGPFGRDLAHHYHLIDVENLAIGYLRGIRATAATYRSARSTRRASAPRLIYADFDETVLPWKSADLSRAIGVDPTDFEPKHTALADARWAKALYEAMIGDPE